MGSIPSPPTMENFSNLVAGDVVFVNLGRNVEKATVTRVTKSYIIVNGYRYSPKTGNILGFKGGTVRVLPFLSIKEPAAYLQKLLCERMREYYGAFGKVQAIGIAGDDEYHAYFEKFFPHVKKKNIPTVFENKIVTVIKVGKISLAGV